MLSNFDKWLQKEDWDHEELIRIAVENNLRIARDLEKGKMIYYIIEDGIAEPFADYREFERTLLAYDLMF